MPDPATRYSDIGDFTEGEDDWWFGRDVNHPGLQQRLRELGADVEIRDLDANKTNYTAHEGAKFLATDTGTVYLGDGTNWNEKYIGSWHTLSTVQWVGLDEGPAGLQAAHDALPADGGTIILAGTVAETGITFTKPVHLIGAGARESGRAGAFLDTSGGDGLWLQAPCALESVMIAGDNTSGLDAGYGIRVGQAAGSLAGVHLSNVAVLDQGGNGVEILGSLANSSLDLTARGNSGHQVLVDLAASGDSLEGCVFPRLIATGAPSGDGVRIDGSGSVSGTQISQLRAEANQGWGLWIADAISLHGTGIFGAGTRGNNLGGTAGEIYCQPTVGSGNAMLLGGAGTDRSQLTIASGVFEQLSIRGLPNLIGMTAPAFGEYYLYDDFRDDAIHRRQGTQRGVYRPTGSTNTEPLVGVHYPRWVPVSDTNPTVTGGEFFIAAGDTTERVYEIPRVHLPTGEYEAMLRFEAAPTAGEFEWRVWGNEDASQYISLVLDAVGGTVGNGDFILRKDDGTQSDLASDTWPLDTESKRIGLTRDSSGNLTTYLNTFFSRGVTDAWLPAGTKTQLRNRTDQRVIIDTIRMS